MSRNSPRFSKASSIRKTIRKTDEYHPETELFADGIFFILWVYKEVNEMAVNDRANAYHERMFPGYVSDFLRTDPEFIERFDNFAFDEVVNEEAVQLDDKTRFIAILAVLIGSSSVDEFRGMMKAALNFDVSAVEIKEIIYQAVDYLGIGRVFPFLKVSNEILESLGYELPLEPQSTTTAENRYEKGEEAQIAIFGESMRGYGESGPAESRHINKWLVDNCFGDFYTRKGLDYRQRELITFCFLYAQGGCEPQLAAHTAANMRLGNDKAFLIKVISNCIPFMGYPRTLNALRIINEEDAKLVKINE